MKNKISKALRISGLVIIAAVMCFIATEYFITVRASNDLYDLGVELEEMLPKRSVGIAEERMSYSMPVMDIDGTDYVAVLDAIGYSRAIPVRSKWDEGKTDRCVCRYTGSTWNGTLVIGGGTLKNGLDFMKKIDVDDEVTVTDMAGRVFTYCVYSVKHPDKISSEKLINEEADLVLFSKGESGYVIVNCKFKGN